MLSGGGDAISIAMGAVEQVRATCSSSCRHSSLPCDGCMTRCKWGEAEKRV
ncbi:hypothetical protein HMPREF9597_01726 [Cutibacterium acnes HL005PA4]|nr:hypothetical protein HMPREF9585_01889 [Cutibacterium acnes HL083PA1]EFS79067.1 hypothetical protein HMPREF9597_01726 [Cutibacterium acnes HL005PA4]EFS95644.1 hypothetical protein HMPREF9608_00486 [Cutibacterium acnes HL067PA1]EFT12171.1 hypothetical protein HMPREF9620_01867 [Cutibacterium acnes HL037PA1]EFT22364.1 hypothetical protein HMPREF9573_02514 [Cutibacterium acnes HL072PA2]EFT73030.1 hypothetical protein HMPREF9592_02551 [Cutibacterium acnes HL046PA1]EGE72352.1 hypothetical protein